MTADPRLLKQLKDFQSRGDAGRVPYYQAIAASGDPYGRMALGVVQQGNMAGRVAYSYAKEVGKRYCRPIDNDRWLDISISLMRADYRAREDDASYASGSPSLQWFIIRDYHRATFAEVGRLPPEAWTAWIPLLLDGEGNDSKLWHRMLTEDFLTIGVQTAWLVLGRLVHKEGVDKDMATVVVPTLKVAPPVVTAHAPSDPSFGRCMARLAPYQLQGSEATQRERMAVFYLSVLASASNVLGDVTDIMPNLGGPATGAWNTFGPSWGPTVGDVQRAF